MKIRKTTPAIITAAALSVCTGCSKTEPVKAPEVSLLDTAMSPNDVVFDWQKPFEDKLNEFKSSDNCTDSSMFELLDVTGDGSPELIISPSDDVSAKCAIYMLINGNVDKIGETGSYGTFIYIPSMNAIGSEYIGDGFNIGEYFVYEEGSFNKVINYFTNSGSAASGGVIRYEINDNIVTLVKFEEMIHPYKDSPSVAAGRKFSMSDETIDYALHCSESWGQVLTDKQKQLYRERIEAVVNTNDYMEAAFEIVDLDLNGLPEVVLSTGMLNDSPTRIFYLEEDGVKELETGCDADGGILLDLNSKIFYGADYYGTIQCWSISGADISSFTPSNSIMHCGRRYELNPENLSAVFSEGNNG